MRNSAGWFQMEGGQGGLLAASSLTMEAEAVRDDLIACVEEGHKRT